MPLQIRTITPTCPEYPALLQLREAVLRAPLGRILRPQDTARDAEATLITAYNGEELCGCVILNKNEDNTAILRQMAVHKNYEGQGIGRKLVEFLEAEAKTQNITAITLHARESAIPFYEKLGYTPTSGLHGHEDLPISHIYMQKTL